MSYIHAYELNSDISKDLSEEIEEKRFLNSDPEK